MQVTDLLRNNMRTDIRCGLDVTEFQYTYPTHKYRTVSDIFVFK